MKEKTAVEWLHAQARQEKALKRILVDRQRGLEFGPRDMPYVPKAAGEVYYLDHVTGEELRNRMVAGGQISADRAHEVLDTDYVLETDKTLKDIVGADEKFDYAIASHVLEHIPDVIRWFQQVAEILRPCGTLSLILPDKRYSLDYIRPETTLGEWMEAYWLKREKPSLKSIFDSFDLTCIVDPKLAAAGLLDSNTLTRLNALGTAYMHCKNVHEMDIYIDCHSWVFNPAGFFELLRKLILLDLFDFAVAEYFPTNPDEGDFFVSFQSIVTPDDPIIRRQIKLDSLPVNP